MCIPIKVINDSPQKVFGAYAYEKELCPPCHEKSEDLEHFLLNCPALSALRDQYFSIFSDFSDQCPFSINFTELPPSVKLLFIIGDIGYVFNDDVGIFYDFYCKEFLKKCFNFRSDMMIL